MVNIYHAIIPKRLRSQNKHHSLHFVYYFAVNRFLKSIDINNLPLFQYIEIETVNRCNGKCSFCPVNVNEPQRPYAKMTWELFSKLIEELKSYDYDGTISLFSNNEPFLDERIHDWMKYAKEMLPQARFTMYTNGSVLTMEKFLETIKYTSSLTIDNYSDDNTINANLKEIYEYIQTHSDLKEKVYFSMRKRQEELTTRGGQAPNRKNERGDKGRVLLSVQTDDCPSRWKMFFVLQ